MPHNSISLIGKIFDFIEKTYRTHKIIVWIWGFLPQKQKEKILRFVNPSVTLGAIAVIIDPNSSQSDPCVLLGWHSYHEKEKIPWGLIGGALKRRDRSISDSSHSFIPVHAVIREVKEETALDIEVVKLLAIDTDWNLGTMDFYFECLLKHGYPKEGVQLKNPELKQIKWFKISELPDDMNPQHKGFLLNVLASIPRLPGVSWTANQRPPAWWVRYQRAENIKMRVSNSNATPEEKLGILVDEARRIIDCEVVSLFATQPPIKLISPDFEIPRNVEGVLNLVTESHEVRGLSLVTDICLLPISPPSHEKLGLAAWALREQPLGEVIRLHDEWLQNHPHAKNSKNQDHLTDRTCHSLAVIVICYRNRVLGLLKAENKKKYEYLTRKSEFIPFGPDDGYILKKFAEVAVPYLEERGNNQRNSNKKE